MKTGLEGKTVLITGAARNMGRHAAITFAQEGCNLALCTSQSMGGLHETAELAGKFGVKVMAEKCDITEEAAVASFVKNAHGAFGSIDVVLNCVGFRSEADLLTEPVDRWMRNVAVNLHGPYFICRQVIPHMMEKKWGRIINFSGISTQTGSFPGKAMVKLGIVGFTRGLAKAYGSYNITANCIAPGYIEVEREDTQVAKGIRSHQPIRRGGTLDELTSLVVYLASDGAGYITGQCHWVNGGAFMQ